MGGVADWAENRNTWLNDHGWRTNFSGGGGSGRAGQGFYHSGNNDKVGLSFVEMSIKTNNINALREGHYTRNNEGTYEFSNLDPTSFYVYSVNVGSIVVGGFETFKYETRIGIDAQNGGMQQEDPKQPIKWQPKGEVVYRSNDGDGWQTIGIKDEKTGKTQYYTNFKAKKDYSNVPTFGYFGESVSKGIFNVLTDASYILPNVFTGGRLGFDTFGEDHYKFQIYVNYYMNMYFPVEPPTILIDK